MCTTRISYQLLNLKSVCLISESYDTLSLTLSYNPPCMSLSPSLIVGVCIHRTPNKLSILNLNSVCIISVIQIFILRTYTLDTNINNWGWWKKDGIKKSFPTIANNNPRKVTTLYHNYNTHLWYKQNSNLVY
jgi:hypothetical protein